MRKTMLPYSRQWLDDDDIAAVVEVLQSDWLTTGPKVLEFENRFAEFIGAKHAIAVCNGTAALHAAMHTIGIGPGDEVIVPTMTFAATANCVVYQGATPVFADVEPETLLLAPQQVEAKITSHTKAIIAVDYAAQPCDYDALRQIADRNGLVLVADACHSLGAEYKGKKVGTLADLTVFSFHPVKQMTTGEGGMVVTDNHELSAKMYRFRNHGIGSDQHERGEKNTWYYEISHLGYNYRLTDFQCTLGLSQLRKLPGWLARRQEIAQRYDAAFAELQAVKPLSVRDDVAHAYHLYVVRLNKAALVATRAEIFAALRAEGIGVNVHYVPVHRHPYYRERFNTNRGDYPVAETAYEDLLSLPIFPRMSDAEADDVIAALHKVVEGFRR